MENESLELKRENDRLRRALERAYSDLDESTVKSATRSEITYADLRGHIQKYQRLFMGTLKILVATIEAKEPHLRGHSSRVNEYAKAIGVELGLAGEQLEFLQYAALLHDVGIIGIDEMILSKPGPLDKGEWGTIKDHPLLGASIIEHIELFTDILPFVIHHHENFDGTGYPRGLKGVEIPYGARIIAVAEAFDAMISPRPYRDALSLEDAKEELKAKSGSQFDPQVVEAILSVIDKGILPFNYSL